MKKLTVLAIVLMIIAAIWLVSGCSQNSKDEPGSNMPTAPATAWQNNQSGNTCETDNIVLGQESPGMIEVNRAAQIHGQGYDELISTYHSFGALWLDREKIVVHYCTIYGDPIPNLATQQTISPQEIVQPGFVSRLPSIFTDRVQSAVTHGRISQQFADLLLSMDIHSKASVQSVVNWAASHDNVVEQGVAGVLLSDYERHEKHLGASPTDDIIVLMDLLGTLELGPEWGLFCSVVTWFAINRQ